MTTLTGIAPQRYEIEGPSFGFTIAKTVIGNALLCAAWWQNFGREEVVFTLTNGLLVWLVSCARGGDPSIIDKVWSLEPPLLCWYFFFYNPSPRLLLICVLTTMWGVRLTWNFWIKGGYTSGGEDYRWAIVRRWFPGWRFHVFNLVFICGFQQILLLSITAAAAHMSTASCLPFPSIGDGIAAILFLVFLTGETIADWQMYTYQREKWKRIKRKEELSDEYGRGFITSGLWSISRHPNYVCEVLIWWTLYLFLVLNCEKDNILWAALGPLNLTILFVAPGASADVTEQISASKYPQYTQYQRQVPRLIPFFSPKQSEVQPILKPLSRWIYIVFFASHIPITLFIDIQAIFPRHSFPRPAQDLLDWHIRINHDDLMAQPPLWLRSVIWCEFFFQLPFFFVALKALYHKTEALYATHFTMYGAHVATTLVPILAHFAYEPHAATSTSSSDDYIDDNDVNKNKHIQRRLCLILIYLPYFLVPLSLFFAFNKSPRLFDKDKKSK